LVALWKERASNQEVILTALIAARTNRPTIQIYRDVKKGVKSWGTQLGEAKIQAATIQPEFAALLIKSPR
jgi:hypothetical protein